MALGHLAPPLGELLDAHERTLLNARQKETFRALRAAVHVDFTAVDTEGLVCNPFDARRAHASRKATGAATEAEQS